MVLWVQNASADVIVVTTRNSGYFCSQGTFEGTGCYYSTTTCPTGYVAISCLSTIDSQIAIPYPSHNPTTCGHVGAVCAKVCN